jgi:MoaA/NifB/PqqE/SkfB family radical SAM enzyme
VFAVDDRTLATSESRRNRRALGASYVRASEVSDGLPVYLVIESTSICNLKCVMCPYPTMGRKNEHMAMSVYEKIIDEARGHVEFMWLHLFGEPLLNHDIYKMIDLAEEAGVRVGISTNATRLTEEASRALLDSRLSILILCLDGATKETYEAIRVGGKFEKVSENIRRFAEIKRNSSSRLHASLQMIAMDMNAGEQERFQQEWKHAGFETVLIKGFFTWANQDPALITFGPAPQPSVTGVCHEPWVGMTVLADGTAVPCCADYSGRNPLGDLKTQSLREVWNGSEMRKLRRMLSDPHSDRTGTLCDKCPFPVTDPAEALYGLGVFNPAEDHLGLYCMGSGGTEPVSRDFGRMIRIRTGDELPGVLAPGEAAYYNVIVSNNSPVTLRSSGSSPVNLSYHWYSNEDGRVVVYDGVRTVIRPDLTPFNERSYNLRVIAPDREGSYRLQVCLVQEGVMWLDEEISSCLCGVTVRDMLQEAIAV